MTQIPDEQASQLIDEGHKLMITVGDDNDRRAIAKFDRAIAISPNGVWVGNAYYYKGQALVHLQRYVEACEAFEQALRINPRDGEAKRDLDSALRHLK